MFSGRRGWVLVAVIFALLMVIGLPLAAEALTPMVTAQVEPSPYEPPEITQVDAPGWAVPFAPLARLPLWAMAAVISAAIAGLVFVIPIASRWLWRLGEGGEQTAEESNP